MPRQRQTDRLTDRIGSISTKILVVNASVQFNSFAAFVLLAALFVVVDL